MRYTLSYIGKVYKGTRENAKLVRLLEEELNERVRQRWEAQQQTAQAQALLETPEHV